MPLDPVNDRRPPVTPQMALRVAGVGVLALVLFGIIFFRLWYLQVLDGDKYLAQARSNRVRTERIQAPRGEVVDRYGNTLIGNRRATVVTIDPRSIPLEFRTAIAGWGQQMTRRSMTIKRKGHPGPPPPMPQAAGETSTLFHRLATVLQLSPQTVNRRVVSSILQVPYADIRVKTAVDVAQRDFLEEHKELFPGVTVDEAYLRSYPYKQLAAQLIGSVGEISKAQLADKKDYKGIKPGTYIGQSGIEAEYDKYLRGNDGVYRIEVNAAGERRAGGTTREPTPGKMLKLTLDLGLQQKAEQALQDAGNGHPGAFVALNPDTGAVYAMGSYPTYNPSDLNRPFSSQAAYDRKFGHAAGDPLFNRAIGGFYPTGSVFKPITSLAALQTGVTSTGRIVDDKGCINVGTTLADQRCNAGSTAYGPVNLSKALQVSSDVYFYEMGKELDPKPGHPLQKWARRLGLGHRTGVDLPGEGTGLVPDRAWRDRQNRKEARCRKKLGHPCGYADGTNRPWTGGDEVNLAIGQGDLQASPLQMAVVYSTIVMNGKVPRPHVGQEVEDSRGTVEKILQPASKHVKGIDPGWRAAILEGLHLAASAKGGTSADVFKDWPQNRYPVFGKTGTAQRPGHSNDQSWYVAYAYDKTRPDANPIVVACTIEDAGFGAEAAAPAVRLMLSKWFHVKAALVRGSSTTR
jgi:penicillin-binding protein 2